MVVGESARLDVERTPPPADSDLPWSVHPRSMTGHGGPWGTLLPALNRILLEPDAGHDFPGPPEQGSAHAHAIAYWHAALDLLVYRLGWVDPAAGLERWLKPGTPVNDRPTLVLRDIYHNDGHLPLLLAWLRTGPAQWWVDTICGAAGATQPVLRSPSRPDRDSVAKAERLDAHNPLTGGSDPLHLADHLSHTAATDNDHDGAEMFTSAPDQRRALLVLDTAEGWYAQLGGWGHALPDIGDRSWHVEVVIRPAGSLGVFRRSHQTGMWFQGRHRTHQLAW